MPDSLLDGFAPPELGDEFDAAVFDWYVGDLQSADCTLHIRPLRFAYTAAAGVKYRLSARLHG